MTLTPRKQIDEQNLSSTDCEKGIKINVNPIPPRAQEGPTIYLYVGIFLLACFASLHYYPYSRLRERGYKKSIFNFPRKMRFT